MIAAHGIIQNRRQKTGKPSTKYFFSEAIDVQNRQIVPKRALPYMYVFTYLHQPFWVFSEIAGITNTCSNSKHCHLAH